MKKRKKVLVVSSFPPQKCGIGTYAAEHVLHLKKEGLRVYTLAVDGNSVGSFHIDPTSPKSIIRHILIVLFSGFHAIYVHYTADFFFPPLYCGKKRFHWMRLLQTLFLFVLGKKSGKDGAIIFHEAYPGIDSPEYYIDKRGQAFAAFQNLEFHTEVEQQRILAAFPRVVSPKQTKVVVHERYMQPKYFGDRSMARRDLGLDDSHKIFLCIGFIQEHKGFHTAAEIFAKASSDPHAYLYIVGSLRVRDPGYVEYLDRLRLLVSAFPNVRLVEQFVSDEDFDKWIVASDIVLLPYREISSSGVGGRAVLLKRHLIANGQTNLKNQFIDYDGVTLYSGDQELASLLSAYEHKGAAIVNTQEAATDNRDNILFVMPWFGPQIKGGAEQFIFDLCTNLAHSGKKIEVWASASLTLSHRNNLLAHDAADQGLPFKIRRFSSNRFAEVVFRKVHPRMIRSSGGGRLDGFLWARSALTGNGMEQALREEGARFSSIHLCHYFGGSTHRLAGIFPEKTILHPFIHNEPPLYHPVMRDLFAGVRGVMCNTRAERLLGERSQAGLLGSCYKPIGNSVIALETASTEAPKKHMGVNEIIYIGRLIPEKNLLTLVDWVIAYNEQSPTQPLKLILVGDGPLQNDPKIRDYPWIEKTGRLGEEDKRKRIQKAFALVQPSLLESFSLVLLEAWAEKTPVIVHADCAATNLLVAESGGGIAVKSADEFILAIERLWYDQPLARGMGEDGHRFARENFTWPEIVDRFEQARASILGWPNSYREFFTGRRPNRFVFPTRSSWQCSLEELDGRIERSLMSAKERKLISYIGNQFYVEYESVFRDPSQEYKIFPSWSDYLEIAGTMGVGDTWVDIGAGRGYFLQYLSSNGIAKEKLFGVEPDSYSFVEMRKKGFAGCSLYGDRFLELLPDKSITFISMLHVAEHIPWDDLCCLMKLAYNKLKPGGKIIVEMPNVKTVKTSAVTFWQDPTHIRPVIDQTLAFLMKFCGFKIDNISTYAPHISSVEVSAGRQGVDELLVKDFYGDQDVTIFGSRIE